MPATQRRLPRWLVGGGVIAVAMAIMNVTNYAFTMLAARLLGPAEYSALAAVMGLLMVLNVLSLGLQATAARRVSANPQHATQIEAAILRTSYVSALGLGLVCLAATPLIDGALRLDGWALSALLAVTVVPLTIMGGQAGVLQGERRWLPLAAIYLTSGLGRIGFGATGLLLRDDALGGMLGLAVGAFFPTVIGWFVIRRHERTPPPAEAATGGMLHELASNSHSLLAFFALSNADVVIARTVLDEHEAGLYAGGLILAKAVLFLPQFVSVVAFPAMASPAGGRRMHLYGLGLVVAIGLTATAGVLVLAPVALTFIGGGEYAEIQSSLWAFATLGTLLAALQMLVYSVLARQHQRMVFAIWGALLTLLTLATLVSSVTALLVTVCLVDGVLLLVLATWSMLTGHASEAQRSEVVAA